MRVHFPDFLDGGADSSPRYRLESDARPEDSQTQVNRAGETAAGSNPANSGGLGPSRTRAAASAAAAVSGRTPEKYGPITLRNLMTHTPGFEDTFDGSFVKTKGELVPYREYLIAPAIGFAIIAFVMLEMSANAKRVGLVWVAVGVLMVLVRKLPWVQHR